MQIYEVREGDSPGSIAADFAGCPKCARDLVKVNSHKPIVTLPNGFATFRSLRVGEKLWLPDKWFTSELDELPPAYFAALPHPDGVTPSKLGALAAAGVLGDFNALDTASSSVALLAQVGDQAFNSSVNAAASLIDAAVHEADTSTNPAVTSIVKDIHAATAWAKQRGADFAAASTAGDQSTAATARTDAQTALSTALSNAKSVIQTIHSSPATKPEQPELTLPPLVINLPPARSLPIQEQTFIPPQKTGMSTGAIMGLALIGVGAVGGVIYLSTTPPKQEPVLRRVYPEVVYP